MAQLHWISGLQAIDNNGEVIPGARLYSFDAGTTTPKFTYDDNALSSQNTNPIIADANGYFGPIFVRPEDIKFELRSASDVTIRTWDNANAEEDVIRPTRFTGVATGTNDLLITASDVPSSYADGQVIQFVAAATNTGAMTVDVIDGEGNNLGVVDIVRQGGAAMNAGDVVANFPYSIQYVASINDFVIQGLDGLISGSESEAEPETDDRFYFTDTSAGGQAFFATYDRLRATPVFGGYLTPTSGLPIVTSDVNSTSVFYTPIEHNLITVYNGAAFVNQIFAELELTLNDPGHAADTIYDVFVDNDTANLRISTGTAWATSTAGSGDRGTGGSTTELTRINGVLVNANAMTMRNGATTFALGANLGTYVGSILINGITAGQVNCTPSFGQSRRWGVWNAYNRRPIIMRAGDSTASWTYNAVAFRPSNNDSGNSISAFTGLQEERIDCRFNQYIRYAANSTTAIGIGINSTGSPSGQRGSLLSDGTVLQATPQAAHIQNPILGQSDVNCLESGTTINVPTFQGTSANMLLTVRYQG